MPELPEVETIARGLAKRITGDVIESVWVVAEAAADSEVRVKAMFGLLSQKLTDAVMSPVARSGTASAHCD